MEKTTFVFNCEWIEAIADFEPAVRFEIYEAIMRYATTGQLSELSPVAKAVFFFIRKEMDFNRERYEQTVAKRKAAAQKRWAKKSAEAATTEQKPDNEFKEDNAVKETKELKEIKPVEPTATAATVTAAEQAFKGGSAHKAEPAFHAKPADPADPTDELLEELPFPVSDTVRSIVADLQRTSPSPSPMPSQQQPDEEEYITYEEHLRRKRLREQAGIRC